MPTRGRRPGTPDEEPPVEFSSSIALNEGYLAEEVITPSGPQFVLYRDDPESYPVERTISGFGPKIVPLPVDPKLLGSLKLPEGVVPYDTVGGVVGEKERLALEVFDPVDELEMFRLVLRLAVASWIIGVLYPKAGRERYAPIIQIIGLPENGKGRFETVCREFFYRSLYLNKTIRVPSLFRAIEPWTGTLILDEADLDRSAESSEFIEFLNGRAYGNPNLRYSAESDKTRAFLSFGYTILATRNPYTDPGFNSRAIILRSQAAADANRIPLVPSEDWYNRAMRVRCQLLLLRFRVWSLVRAKKIVPPSNFKIEGLAGRFRVRAAFLPLAALKPIAPELLADCEKLAREIHRRQVAERAESIEGQLLGQIYEHLQGESEWSLRKRNRTWRFEREVDGEPSGEPKRIELLTLNDLCAPFGDHPPRRSLSNAWKNFGQGISARERRGEKLYRSVVVVANPGRLCRELGLYVPDARPMEPRFGLTPPQAADGPSGDELAGPATATLGTSVPPVPHVLPPGAPLPHPLPPIGRPPLGLESPVKELGGEDGMDRAVRTLGPTIRYPDGTVTDRRTGEILSRPVGAQQRGTSGTSGTNPPGSSAPTSAVPQAAVLRWEDDGGRPASGGAGG